MPQVTRFFRTLERLSSWRQALSHFETCLENSSTTIIFEKFYFYDNDRFFGSNLRPRRSSFEISGRSWAICHHFPLFFLLEIRSPPINISRISMTFEKKTPESATAMLVIFKCIKSNIYCIWYTFKSVTNILKLSSTHFVSNIRRQHRFSHSILRSSKTTVL